MSQVTILWLVIPVAILIVLRCQLRALVGGICAQFSNNTEAQFTHIYKLGTWCFRGPTIPRSGPGARVAETILARQALSDALHDYEVTMMLDAACGDMTWMPLLLQEHPKVQYTGVDIVRELLEKDQRHYPQLRFYQADLIQQAPDQYDLIYCRETLNHLKTANVIRALENFRRSGSRHLLINNAPRRKRNIDIIAQNGMYRGINWLLPPYNLKPIRTWGADHSHKTYILVRLN